MTDEELIARLREIQGQAGLFASSAADRIEQLVATNEALVRQVKDEQAAKFKMRDERDAAKIAASNYADFNHTWRKRAEQLAATCERLAALLDRAVNGPWLDGDLERARAALTEAQKDRTDD